MTNLELFRQIFGFNPSRLTHMTSDECFDWYNSDYSCEIKTEGCKCCSSNMECLIPGKITFKGESCSDKDVTAKLSEDNKMILAVDGLVKIEILVEVVKNLIGAMDVIHCKDCEKYKERRFPDGQTYGWFCQETHYGRNPDDFCSYGVRKE